MIDRRVPDKPIDQATRGRLRAIYEWLKPATLSPHRPLIAAHAPDCEGGPARIGHYLIQRKLGEGGMGVVYAAHDERLKRTVALKLMSSLGNDERARTRFWREARVAASVNHPNICQIYDISEDHGDLFIAMELLEGEALSERVQKGPIAIADALPIAFGMLAALSALHARGIVHRDLKPSNVFLTPHSVKLLDFGLARLEPNPSLQTAAGLTHSGTVLGTPSYMAPEQVMRGIVDCRCDLFAAGAILFELLAGRRAFEGRTAVDILHATLHEQPPALTGTPAVTAVDRVIRRALAKRPEERPASADAMADALRAIRGVDGSNAACLAHPLTRLVVLPFRILRPDPDTDFLAFSLPDAIATSLSGIGSLIVRSSTTAARFTAQTPDLKALAAEADVDRVVLGTLLRSGDQLRAVAQLVEAPGGTLLTSHAVQSSLGDLFRLQDDIAGRVADALSLPLTGDRASPIPDAPQSASAYELYLRANELARTFGGLVRARELYERCLERDPGFAPAWARLGRCHRVIGKFVDGTSDSESRAQQAFSRALDINPRLSVAHKFYANLEGDMGRSQRALVRLLGEADRHGNDPELFAGIVHACRYCGLFDESVAAHAEARRLDRNVPTSLGQTLLMACDIDGLLSIEPPPPGTGSDEWIQARVTALALAGRRDESRELLAEMRQVPRVTAFQAWGDFLLGWLDRCPTEMLAALSVLGALRIHDDPEFVFRVGWLLCDVGEHEHGLLHLRRALTKSYCVARTLSASPSFDPLRSDPRFQALLTEAEVGRRHALTAFREAGGERLLGR
jgi:serine/threonine protein kinase/tetratricopeptide (TPR) repeat protein